MTDTVLKQQLKVMVRGTYQIQRLRIAMGNRIVGNFKAKLGQDPGISEEDALDEKEKKVLESIRIEYKKFTDGAVKLTKQENFVGSGIIDSYTEFCLLTQYFEMESYEKLQFDRIQILLGNFPIWTEFMKGVKGVGRAMAGTIISEIDIHRTPYPSSLWKYCGLDVGWDNKGRSKRKEHLEKRPYLTSDKKIKEKNSITYNARLKTKLMGVLADVFIKSGGSESPYRKAYNDYKQRLMNSPRHCDIFVAVNLPGKLPRILTQEAFDRNFANCLDNVNIPDDIDVDDIDAYRNKKAKAAQKEYLGNYAIFENLLESGLAVGPTFDEKELSKMIKAIGGVLRKPKTVQVAVSEEEIKLADVPIFFVEEEVFDDTPDTKGRTVFRMKNIGKTQGHRNWMAKRYMIKRFLVDLYTAWRTLEGLPVSSEYSVGKLGMVHGEPKSNMEQAHAALLIKAAMKEQIIFDVSSLSAAICVGNTLVSNNDIITYIRDLQHVGFIEQVGNKWRLSF